MKNRAYEKQSIRKAERTKSRAYEKQSVRKAKHVKEKPHEKIMVCNVFDTLVLIAC